MQCACAMLLSVACPALQIVSTLFHKRHDFRKSLLNVKSVFFLYKYFWNISYSKKKLARYDQKLYVGLHVKYRLLLYDFNETWIFSTYFRKILKYQKSWKSVHRKPCCSMQTDGQTDMTKLIVVFRHFSKVYESGPRLRGHDIRGITHRNSIS